MNKVIEVIQNYGSALKHSDVSTAVRLYSKDAEIIPDGQSSISTHNGIVSFYENTFKEIKIYGDLKIIEMNVIDNLAIVRCEEVAEVEILSTGERKKLLFRELFILKDENGWKIYKYMFSSI